jgi:transcriptional regulator with XRE-family HTH domain
LKKNKQNQGPLAKKITELRELKGMTKSEMGGLSQSTMQKIENENQIPKKTTLVKLASALGCGETGLTELNELADKQRRLRTRQNKPTASSPGSTRDRPVAQTRTAKAAPSKRKSTTTAGIPQREAKLEHTTSLPSQSAITDRLPLNETSSVKAKTTDVADADPGDHEDFTDPSTILRVPVNEIKSFLFRWCCQPQGQSVDVRIYDNLAVRLEQEEFEVLIDLLRNGTIVLWDSIKTRIAEAICREEKRRDFFARRLARSNWGLEGESFNFFSILRFFLSVAPL